MWRISSEWPKKGSVAYRLPSRLLIGWKWRHTERGAGNPGHQGVPSTGPSQTSTDQQKWSPLTVSTGSRKNLQHKVWTYLNETHVKDFLKSLDNHTAYRGKSHATGCQQSVCLTWDGGWSIIVTNSLLKSPPAEYLHICDTGCIGLKAHTQTEVYKILVLWGKIPNGKPTQKNDIHQTKKGF